MLKLRYYCQGEGKEEIRKLLTDVKKKHGITYEISDLSRNRTYDEEKEKQVYERDFKPRAKVLKERTCEPITRLRSRKARHYFISLPGTITIIGNEGIEWYTLGDEQITKFLNAVLGKGYAFLEECCK
jgi:flagellar motor switch protein FliM